MEGAFGILGYLLRVGWCPLLRFLRLNGIVVVCGEAGDETAVEEVEGWEERVREEDVQCEERAADVWWCVLQWVGVLCCA